MMIVDELLRVGILSSFRGISVLFSGFGQSPPAVKPRMPPKPPPSVFVALPDRQTV